MGGDDGEGSEPRVINSGVAAAAVTYVWRSLGEDGLGDLLSRLDQPDLRPLLDPAIWVPYSYFRRLVDAAAAVCADPDIGSRIGEEVVRLMGERDLLGELIADDMIGTLEGLVAGIDASSAVRDLRIVDRAERVVVAEGRAVLHPDDRTTCRIIAALLSAFPAAIGVTATAVESSCTTLGADRCRFEVRWVGEDQVVPPADDQGPLARTVAWASALVQTEDLDDALNRACETVLGHVAGAGLDLVLPDGRSWRWSADAGPAPGREELSTAVSPVVVSGKPAGRVVLRRLGESGPAEHRRADLLAEQIGSVISTALALTDIRDRAHRDPLTGAANRAALEQRAAGVLSSTMEAALVFVDLDGFKDVNDSHGHAAGDQVLREVAQRLTAVVRSSDLVSRIGGDEFIVLLADIPTQDAVERSARKLRSVFDAPFMVGGRVLHLQASFGVARSPEDGADLTSLVGRADQRMYAAKRRG